VRAVVQRARRASLRIDGSPAGTMEDGLVVLVGIVDEDSKEDVEWLTRKIVNLRLFDGENGRQEWNLLETGGGLVVVSQFTLHASTKKGTKPSFHRAAAPDHAEPLYRLLMDDFTRLSRGKVIARKFGAMMEVELVNDGPVTILLDTKNKE
jgi:D-tyrosyl-tRNA(Tyr) deacylase